MKWLALVAALAIGGCRGARAGAGDDGGQAAAPVAAPAAMPADWRPLPAVAEAAERAAGEAAERRATTRVGAWGDPGLGCFVTVIEVTGVPGHARLVEIADELHTTLGVAATVEDWRFVDGAPATISADVAAGPMRGHLAGRLSVDPGAVARGTIVTCFYNDREPDRCAALCAPMLAALDPAKAIP